MKDNNIYNFKRLFDDGGLIPIVLDPTDCPNTDGVDGLIIDTSVCDNPECACREIRLRIYKASRNGSMMSRRPDVDPWICAAFDVDTQKVMLEEFPGGPEPEAERIFGLFEQHIEGYAAILTQRYHHERSRLHEESWKRHVPLNYEEDMMLGFYELFPDWYDMDVWDGDTRYWIYDHWCVKPGCKCKETMLTVLYEDSPKSMAGVSVDTRRWKVAAGQPDSAGKRIVERFLSLPENKKKMKSHEQRIKTVKAFFASEQAKVAAAPNGQRMKKSGNESAPTRKIGRNDPCPCGSGKKYKRCCG